MKNSDQPLQKITRDVGAKHFRNLDAKIRKKWNKLYEYREGRSRSPQQSNGYTLKLNTEPSLNISLNCSFNPYSVQQLRAEKNRIITYQRYRKNNQIFFKKRNSVSIHSSPKKQSHSPLNLKQNQRSSSHSNKLQINNQNQQNKGLLPFMLQRRTKQMQRSFDIIEHFSRQSIKEIDIRQRTVFERHYSQKRKLFEKIKGTKVYYQFIKEWKIPISKDEQ